MIGKRAFFTALTAVWLITIFWFSAQPAKQSTQMSHRVGHLVGEWLVPGFDNWTPPQRETFAAAVDFPVRKAAHASEYALLAILFLLTLRSYGRKEKLYVRVLLAVVIYAASDELHQYFVPGRAAKITDVLIDTAGGLAGMGVFLFFTFVSSRIKKH